MRASPGSVALTFDDGYGNFREHALPVLLEMGFPATVFVATGYVGREANWEDQIRLAATRPIMSRAELREIGECGVKLGAHSVNHCDLTELSAEELVAEMKLSRDALASENGETPACFAYQPVAQVGSPKNGDCQPIFA